MFSISSNPIYETQKTFRKISQDDRHVKVQYLNRNTIDLIKSRSPNASLQTRSFELLSAEIKKFDQFLSVNQTWSNMVRLHFEVKSIQDVELNKPSDNARKTAYNDVVKKFVEILDPLTPTTSPEYKLNEVTVKFLNYSCANDRSTKTVTLSNFSPSEKQCLFFQILYMKLIYQLLGYKLDRDAFYKSVCIHRLPKPTTFVYIINYLKYVFTSEHFISMSLLDTIADVTPDRAARATEGAQTGYRTRASQTQATERLMDELNDKFLARGTNIPAAFFNLFKTSLESTVATFKCEIYTEAPALAEGDLLFANYPLNLMNRYIQQNILFNQKLDSLRDSYNIFKCLAPKKRGQQACNLSKDYFDQKIEKVDLTNQKQKLVQKVQTFNNLFKNLKKATQQLEKNEPVFVNNAYSSIFLTEGK